MRAWMRPRVRIVLPLVQVVVAIALLTSNFLRPNPMSSPSWRAPDWQFCAGLNGPATVARDWLIRLTNGWSWGHARITFAFWTTLYFVLVWLLWYLVSIEIGGKGRSVLAPKTGTPRTANLFLIIIGAAVGLCGLSIRHESAFADPYSTLVAMPYFVWGIVIVVFYGHDLWVSVKGTANRHAGENRV